MHEILSARTPLKAKRSLFDSSFAAGFNLLVLELFF